MLFYKFLVTQRKRLNLEKLHDNAPVCLATGDNFRNFNIIIAKRLQIIYHSDFSFSCYSNTVILVR